MNVTKFWCMFFLMIAGLGIAIGGGIYISRVLVWVGLALFLAGAFIEARMVIND